MLRWQRETQRVCESLEWLVVETRGDDGAGWGCHLLFRGDAWGIALYQHAFVEHALEKFGELLVRSVLRPNLSEADARAAFDAAPLIPKQRYVAENSPDYLGSIAPWPGDAAWLMVDGGNEIVLLDVETRATVSRMAIDASSRVPRFKIALDPQEPQIATADGMREFALWDFHDGSKTQVFTGHGEEVHGAVFLDDGTLISGSGDSQLIRWSRDGTQLGVLDTHPIYCIARRPQGGLTAAAGSFSGNAGAIWLVDDSLELVSQITSRKAKKVLYDRLEEDRARAIGSPAYKRADANVCGIAWHPDGRHVLVGAWDYVVKMYDTTTKELVRTWQGHRHWVRGIAVTADGKRFATGCSDGRVRIWAVDAPLCLAEYDCWPGGTEDIYIDGDRIYVSSYDGCLYRLP